MLQKYFIPPLWLRDKFSILAFTLNVHYKNKLAARFAAYIGENKSIHYNHHNTSQKWLSQWWRY